MSEPNEPSWQYRHRLSQTNYRGAWWGEWTELTTSVVEFNLLFAGELEKGTTQIRLKPDPL